MTYSPQALSGFQLGHAHDEIVKTGVTVIRPDQAAVAAVDVRGGGPGTRETDTLIQGGLIDRVHAIVLSGGSVYGLAASDAVCAALGAERIGYEAGGPSVPVSPIVPSAILFDNANGGDKGWGTTPPFHRLGCEALNNASHESAEGAVGAGFGAMAGLYPGGLGIATEKDDTLSVTAVIAANPVGSPFLPGTDVPHAWVYERDDEFGSRRPPKNYTWQPASDTKLTLMMTAGRNTVIGAIMTNAALSQNDLKRLAIMAQDGLALSVQPSHTPLDGDTIFALSVGDKPCTGPVTLSRLGHMAARAVARALTRGVLAAQ